MSGVLAVRLDGMGDVLVLAGARVVVAPNTGPAHLAAAVTKLAGAA